MVFSDKLYIREVNRSRKNWIGVDVEKVLNEDLEFFKGLK